MPFKLLIQRGRVSLWKEMCFQSWETAEFWSTVVFLILWRNLMLKMKMNPYHLRNLLRWLKAWAFYVVYLNGIWLFPCLKLSYLIIKEPFLKLKRAISTLEGLWQPIFLPYPRRILSGFQRVFVQQTTNKHKWVIPRWNSQCNQYLRFLHMHTSTIK